MHHNRKICRTCLCVGDATFLSLDATVPNSDLIPIKEKISFCIPELCLNVVRDAVICAPCLSALHTAFAFKRKCQNTEERIQEYMLNKEFTSDKVDLKELIYPLDVESVTNFSDEPSDLRLNFKKPQTPAKDVEKETEDVDIALVKVEPIDYTYEIKELQEQSNERQSLFIVNSGINETKKPHKCIVCGKAYKREIGLIAHMRIHETNRININNSLKQTNRLTKRLQNSANEIKEFLPKQFDNIDVVCEICQKSFYSKSNLTVHMRIHTGEKPYKCNTCKKAFTQKVYLIAHARTHTGEKPFKCSLCDKSFAQKSYLRTHMIVHTGVRHHICKVCGKGCAHTGDLNNHMRIHTGEKPYKCTDCGKCFTQSVHLKSHIKIHSGEKPFKCELCHVKYTESRYLKKHMRVHSGERPYKCDTCGKTFQQRYVLTEHLKSHTGEKPCVCTVCNKTYSKTSHLTEHMRSHTGEKPYSCSECGMSFAYKQSLNAHLKVHAKTSGVETSLTIKSEPLELDIESASHNENIRQDEFKSKMYSLRSEAKTESEPHEEAEQVEMYKGITGNAFVNNLIKTEPCGT